MRIYYNGEYEGLYYDSKEVFLKELSEPYVKITRIEIDNVYYTIFDINCDSDTESLTDIHTIVLKQFGTDDLFLFQFCKDSIDNRIFNIYKFLQPVIITKATIKYSYKEVN